MFSADNEAAEVFFLLKRDENEVCSSPVIRSLSLSSRLQYGGRMLGRKWPVITNRRATKITRPVKRDDKLCDK